ncbi:Uncharacterised protein [Klebsiella pneumoniae]|nr:Uncharacterised protein [Klebsiella pneumoniae]
MSNIDKLKAAAAKAVDNFDPNMFVETRDVLALLDELEESERLRLKSQEANCELCQKLEAAEKTSAARLGAIEATHKMFQRERGRAEAAEKLTVKMPAFDGYVPHVARELQAAFRIACDNAGIDVPAAAGKGEAS